MTNWFNPDKRSVRFLLFGLMLVGLVMTSAIPEAFGARGKVFAFAYVAMQLCRPLFVLAVLGQKQQLAANYRRILGWAIISAAFWIVGAFRENEARMNAQAAFTLILGPMIYLAANMIYKRMISGRIALSHLLTMAALALLLPLSGWMNLLEVNVAVTLLVLCIIILEQRKRISD